jgi:hypothetical protein
LIHGEVAGQLYFFENLPRLTIREGAEYLRTPIKPDSFTNPWWKQVWHGAGRTIVKNTIGRITI